MAKKTKKKEVRLSPKYGLNPTLPICFWCGEERGDISLLGKIGKKGEDLEAPKHMVIDYEPCEKCRAAMDQGFTLIEAGEQPITEHQAEFSDGVYPTGRWLVLKKERAQAIFGSYLRKRDTDVGKAKMIAVDKKIFESFMN